MTVTDQLVEDAMTHLGVTPVNSLRDGGQKTVKLVRRGDEDLVLKVVSIGSSSPDALPRAKREVELLQSVEHPNVVRAASELIELGDPIEGAAWLEKYLEGEDLSDLFTGQPWSWDDSLVMAIHVTRGLAALHAVHVVHRDLSANNIRRLLDGSYVVMDPGFARHIFRSGLTVGGQPGTAGFLSPEHLQAYSGSPTPASDVFGVGILLFVALTGAFPIPILNDEADYLRRVATGEMQDIATIRTDLSEDQINLVRRMLHPQPARRYRNAAELSEALEAMS